MKKFLFAFIFLSFLIGPVVFAQEATPTLPPGQAWAQRSEIYTPKLLPTNPFYFLKIWKEKLELTFAITAEQKIAKRIELATRRLAEMKAVIETNPEMAEGIAKKYQAQIESIEEEEKGVKGEKREKLMEHLGQMTLKHQQVLLRVYDQAPEAAKKGLENALENSFQGYLQAIESVSKERKEVFLESLGEDQDQVVEKVEEAGEKVGAKVREKVGILKAIRQQVKQEEE